MEKSLTVATWNVNSIRVRLTHLKNWLIENNPDVVALQETKVPNDTFPADEILECGYQCIFDGQKSYNGVALVFKNGLQPAHIQKGLIGLDDTQKRFLAATFNDTRIISIYIPNGESITSNKYDYKLTWLKALTENLKKELAVHQKLILMGDYNIAPTDLDVDDPTKWEGKILCSTAERQAFSNLIDLGLNDCFRQCHPNERLFSWWDYRMMAFQRNKGMRIDYILASDYLHQHCLECSIDTAPRKLERPSDHAPVIAVFRDTVG